MNKLNNMINETTVLKSELRDKNFKMPKLNLERKTSPDKTIFLQNAINHAVQN